MRSGSYPRHWRQGQYIGSSVVYLEAIVWYMIAQQWAIIENDAAGLSAFSISDVSWTFDKNISETWQSVISKYQRW